MTYTVKIHKCKNGINTASLILKTDCNETIQDAIFSMEEEIKGVSDITINIINGFTSIIGIIK